MCSYLVYPSFPLNVVVALCLWWSLFQMSVDLRLRCLLLVVELEPQFQSPQLSLDISGGLSAVQRHCFAILEVIWASSRGGCLIRPAATEVSGLDLPRWRLLTQACSSGGCSPWPGPPEVADLSFLSWMSLTWA